MFHVARKTGHDNDWARWKKQRNLVTKLNRELKRDKRTEKLDILLQSKKDPYKYHTILKDIAGLKRKDQMPPLISDDKILSDETTKANAFNAYFCEQTNINIEDSHLSSLREYSAKQAKTQHVFTHTAITPQEVLRCINKLDSSKACGPDKIPTKVLKMAAVYIAEPLAVILTSRYVKADTQLNGRKPPLNQSTREKDHRLTLLATDQYHYCLASPRSLRSLCLQGSTSISQRTDC